MRFGDFLCKEIVSFSVYDAFLQVDVIDGTIFSPEARKVHQLFHGAHVT